MSLVVAVASRCGAALATDSVYVDLGRGIWTTGYSKMVEANGVAAALTGVANVGDYCLMDTLREAVAASAAAGRVCR